MTFNLTATDHLEYIYEIHDFIALFGWLQFSVDKSERLHLDGI